MLDIIHFKTNITLYNIGKFSLKQTLWSILNVVLFFNLVDEMDTKDESMRETIRRLWPIQSKKMVYKLVPPNDGTVPYMVYVVLG